MTFRLSKKTSLPTTSPILPDRVTNQTMPRGHLRTIQIIKNIGGKTHLNNMENDELAKHQIILSTSAEVQRSAQAVCIDSPAAGNYTCIYAGDGCLADSLFIPAVMHRQVQKGNVYLVVNPDDYEGGMYSGLGYEEEPK